MKNQMITYSVILVIAVCGAFFGGTVTGLLWGISLPLAAVAIILVSLAGGAMLWAGFKETMTQTSVPLV